MIVVVDHGLLAFSRTGRSAADVLFDRSATLMLDLLLASRTAARTEIELYHDLLEQRATQGARMGDA